MPRTLIQQPIITYKKRIVYREQPPSTKSWGQVFFETLGIQLFAFLITTTLTAGVGAIAGAAGLSAFSISGIQTSLAFTTNFVVAQMNDIINDNVNLQNTLLNLAFAANEFGRLGRGFRAQKILTISQEQGILQQLGINSNVKNYYQIAEKLKMTDTITRGKVILRFGEKVTDNEILQAISVLVDDQLLYNVKKMSTDNLKELVQVQKLLKKINPNFVPDTNKHNIKKIDNVLRAKVDISYNDFLKLNDYESLTILNELIISKNVPKTMITEINRNRLAYQFQNEFIRKFMGIQKTIKRSFNYVNPFWYMNKVINKMLSPIATKLANISTKLVRPITESLKKSTSAVFVPCQPESFLLGYTFEPFGLAGEGFLTIRKKPYVWKKAAKVSNYKDIRVYCTLIELEEFATAESQNKYYLDNWALGFGYRQQEYQLFNLIAPKYATIIKQNVDFFNTIKSIPLAAKNININQRMSMESTKFVNKNVNKLINTFSKAVPYSAFIAPHLTNLIVNRGFRKKKLYNQLNSIKNRKVKALNRMITQGV